MSTIGEYTEYDQGLRSLAEAQRYKLRLNAHKGFLGGVPVAVLLDLLKKEVIELEDAVNRGSTVEIWLEAADVANFALGLVMSSLRMGPTPPAYVPGPPAIAPALPIEVVGLEEGPEEPVREPTTCHACARTLPLEAGQLCHNFVCEHRVNKPLPDRDIVAHPVIRRGFCTRCERKVEAGSFCDKKGCTHV